jgi:anti-sigma-K factor RskA
MTELEFDEMMSVRMHEVVAERCLPADFQDRLVRSVKGSKVLWRMKLAVVIAVAVALGIAITKVTRNDRYGKSHEPMLVAADAPADTAEVSSWFLLGYLRECFKRNKNNRKKEEE